MEYLNYGNIHPDGELLKRIKSSLNRMEEPMYAVPAIFHVKAGDQSFDWPGDWEGRTLLALIMLAKVSGRYPKTLDEIIELLPQYINKNGHIGNELSDGVISEQLLAGNSWLMRALCELYEWKKQDSVLDMINAMINGLILKTLGTFSVYPITKAERMIGEGKEAGNLIGEAKNGWLSSTDIGCAFIMIDGASHAYHLTKNKELKKVLTDMVARFAQAELTDATFQTHATLSAVRGILRFYGDTEEKWLLELAEKTFQYYVENGMTENYANHNWFGRSEWTEPCAIIDSFMVAAILWQYTSKSAYLSYEHNILYNAVYYAQRHNGGFGCDVCAGSFSQLIHPTCEESYEAWWCCTMRGGEGLASAAKYMAAYDGDTIYIPMYQCGSFSIDGLKIQETTTYPNDGIVKLEIIENNSSYKKVAFFIPIWAENPEIKVNGEKVVVQEINGFLVVEAGLNKNDCIELQFDISLRAEKAMSEAYKHLHTIRYGTLQLGYKANDGIIEMPELSALKRCDGKEVCFLDNVGHKFFPLGNMTNKSKEEILNSKLQIIY